MKIKILKSASQDLMEGFLFYEKQSEGLGNYFLDTLFSDIDSLTINAGIHLGLEKCKHQFGLVRKEF